MDDAGDSIHRGRNRKYFIHLLTHEMEQINKKNVFGQIIKSYLGLAPCFVISNTFFYFVFQVYGFC